MMRFILILVLVAILVGNHYLFMGDTGLMFDPARFFTERFNPDTLPTIIDVMGLLLLIVWLQIIGLITK